MDSTVVSKMCSFCGQVGSMENRLAGGLGAMICFECLSYYYHQSTQDAEVESRSGAPWDKMSDVEMLDKLPLILKSAAQNSALAARRPTTMTSPTMVPMRPRVGG